MNPIDLLRNNMSEFTVKEAQIAQLILDDPFVLMHLSADQIAKKSKSSKSAFIRLCQKIGYEGYAEFKFSVSRALTTTPVGDERPKNSIEAIASSYSDHILQIPTMVSVDELDQIIQMMMDAQRIKLIGYNRTALSATQLRKRMSKIGFDSEVIDDQIVMRDVASTLTNKDLVVLFTIRSTHGIYDDPVEVMHQKGVKIILITMTPKNHLSKYASLTIHLPYISRFSEISLLDDQAIFFVFIEMILANLTQKLSENE